MQAARIPNSECMIEALRERYPKEAFALLEQVGNGTGYRASRWCDVLVMSLWPSRGLELIGIEIKVSRTDWVRELAAPAKAEPIFQYCDTWYLAAGDEAIVQPGELPKGWGLLVPDKNGKLRCKTEAVANRKPKLDRSFLAAILRRVVDQLTPDALLESKLSTARDGGYQAGRETAQSEVREVQRRMKELSEQVETFENASGVRIRNEWNHGDLGQAVRAVRAGALRTGVRQLERLAFDARKILAEVEVALLNQQRAAQDQAAVNPLPPEPDPKPSTAMPGVGSPAHADQFGNGGEPS